METIHPDLKKAIFNFMIENQNLFGLVNATHKQFRGYIYDSEWQYLIWWKEISEFISELGKLI